MLRKILFVSTALAALPLMAAFSTQADAKPFPRIGQSTNGPAVLFTFTDSGVTTQVVSSQTYDGSDDVEVGVLNNSSSTQTLLHLTGTSIYGGIFGFDGDGITGYTDANTGAPTVGNPADTSGYAGPGITFSNIGASQATGDVNFSLAPSATAYFGLEGSPDSIVSGGGFGPPTGVPEPSSAALILASVALFGGTLRLRRTA